MRGGKTIGLRAFNERLVIDAILQSGPLSKAAIARATGLSGPAASVIATNLLGEGLLIRGEKVRGKIGQPSTPIGINPRGAFSIGISIGRRRLGAVLVDLNGAIIAERRTRHTAPEPDATVSNAIQFVGELVSELDAAAAERIVGIGVAIPGNLHDWSREWGLTPEHLAGWEDRDIATEFLEASGLETVVSNDGAAACVAEMVLGESIVHENALYLFFGTFIGAGTVLEGKLFKGANLNSGAIGSMPTCRTDPSGRPAQLIQTGSIFLLENALDAAGRSLGDVLAEGPSPEADDVFADWLDHSVHDVARAVVAALSVIDCEAVVVDGLLPAQWRRQLVARLKAALSEFDLRGLVVPDIAAGSIGPNAAVRGAALLPLRARFSPDPDFLTGKRRAGAD